MSSRYFHSHSLTDLALQVQEKESGGHFEKLRMRMTSAVRGRTRGTRAVGTLAKDELGFEANACDVLTMSEYLHRSKSTKIPTKKKCGQRALGSIYSGVVGTCKVINRKSNLAGLRGASFPDQGCQFTDCPGTWKETHGPDLVILNLGTSSKNFCSFEHVGLLLFLFQRFLKDSAAHHIATR